MNRLTVLLLSYTLLHVFPAAGSCAGEDTTVHWAKKPNFPSSSRNFGLGFSINGKGYYGMGHKQAKPFVYKTYNDLWEYDPVANTWTQKSDFTGPGRIMAQGFSVGGKIYAGFGYVIAAFGPNAGMNEYQTDFYEFDPSANKWTKKNDALLGRGDLFFVLSDTIYSVNTEFRALNRYDPLSDRWHESKWDKSTPAPSHTEMIGNNISFSLEKKQYFITSTYKRNKVINGLWELDPDKVAWKQKEVIMGKGNDNIRLFTLGKKTYLLRGERGFMEYSPTEDLWFTKDQIPSEKAGYTPLFCIGNRCYGFSKYEFWEFVPE